MTRYRFFVFTCPTSLPFSLFNHSWVVIIKDDEIFRWEVLFRKGSDNTHLHCNHYLPFSGVEVFLPIKKVYWKAKLIYYLEGESAKKIHSLVKRSQDLYFLKNKYSLVGPNCNTYVQWILNNFPDLNMRLPRSCIGRDYNIKKDVNKS